MKTKSIIEEFAPRNATMQYAIADSYQLSKLESHIEEIAEQVRVGESIQGMIEYCDISDSITHTAMKDNIIRLGVVLREVETYLLVLSKYGFCSPAERAKAMRERAKAMRERSECVKAGKCDGKCKTCGDEWSDCGDCLCNITGSDGHKKEV